MREATQDALQVAQDIESETLTVHGSGTPGNPYRSKLRSLIYNLKSNSELRHDVIQREITPNRLVNMNAAVSQFRTIAPLRSLTKAFRKWRARSVSKPIRILRRRTCWMLRYQSLWKRSQTSFSVANANRERYVLQSKPMVPSS